MAELPVVDGRRAVRVFERLGWHVARVSGSHHILKKAGVPILLTVPAHGGRPMKPGTLRAPLRAAGIEPREFRALL